MNIIKINQVKEQIEQLVHETNKPHYVYQYQVK